MVDQLAAPCTRSVIAGKILRACRKLTFLTHRRVKNGVDQRFKPLLGHRSKLNGISLQSPLQLQTIHQCQHACTSSINTSLLGIIDRNPPLFTLENKVLLQLVTKPGIATTEKLSAWVIFRDRLGRKNNIGTSNTWPLLIDESSFDEVEKPIDTTRYMLIRSILNILRIAIVQHFE